MKSTIYRCLSYVVLLLCAAVVTACSGVREKQYRIGVSQCSSGLWREKQNHEMEQELLLSDGFSMELRCADDDVNRQIADIQYFIDQKMDLIIVSPFEAGAVTPIIAKAYKQGIPVVLFDRRVTGDKYSAFVGGDNVAAGRLLAEYAYSQYPHGGQVLELTGSQESSPAKLRHAGVLAGIAMHPELKLVKTYDARWSNYIAGLVIDSLLTCYPDVDVVAAHNDWMALKAKAVIDSLHPGHHVKFVGVDALVGEGIDAIQEGREDASATYPTGGHQIMRTAMSILRGEPFVREQLLESHLVASPEEAALTSSMQRAIDREAENVAQLRDRAAHYQQLDEMPRHQLYVMAAILLLAVALVVSLYRMYRFKQRANDSLTRQRATLKEQRNQLLQLTHELEQATHAKVSFFTNVSHDFRTPLTLIAAPIERLLKGGTNTDSQLGRQMLQLAYRNVHVLKQLVNQILDFQKAENGKMQLNVKAVDLLNEMRLWVESFRGLADKQHVSLSLQTQEGDDSQWHTLADRGKLERVVYNLLGNAFKYTPENGSITVQLSRTRDNNESGRHGSWHRSGTHTAHLRELLSGGFGLGLRRHGPGSGIGQKLRGAARRHHIGREPTDGDGHHLHREHPLQRGD